MVLDLKKTDAGKCHELDVQGYDSCHLAILNYEMGGRFCSF